MCEPISCLIAAGVCCCCLIIVGVMMSAGVASLLGAAKVLMQVLECANTTLHSQIDTLETKNPGFKKECMENTEMDKCHEVEDLSEEKQAWCKEIVKMCQCDLITHLADMESPTFEESIGPCCDEFHQIEQGEEAVGQDGAVSAVKMCTDFVHNITHNFTKQAKCCQSPDSNISAHPEECPMSHTDEEEFMQPVTDGIMSFIEVIGNKHGFQKEHHSGSIDSTHVAMYGSAAILGAFAMVAVVRLRKGRNPFAATTTAPERARVMINEHELAASWAE